MKEKDQKIKIHTNSSAHRSVLRQTAGVSRLIVIMAVAVIALSVPIIWGAWVHFREDAERKECAIAIGSAQRKLDDEYIANPDMTPEEAEAAATSEIRSLEETCPGGGRYVIVKRLDGDGYEIYCELHGRK